MRAQIQALAPRDPTTKTLLLSNEGSNLDARTKRPDDDPNLEARA
jgi:hypothetical protein